MKQETQLVMMLSQLNNKITKSIDGYLSLHGISFTEYLVLRHLSESPSQQSRRADVAMSVGLSASGVTRLLAPMEKIGLVTKEKALRDARVSLVKLSKSGSQIFNDADLTVSQAADNLTENVTAAQRSTLLDLMQKML